MRGRGGGIDYCEVDFTEDPEAMLHAEKPQLGCPSA